MVLALLGTMAAQQMSHGRGVEMKDAKVQKKHEVVLAGFMTPINGKLKMRATEAEIAPGGYIGDHLHYGAGIVELVPADLETSAAVPLSKRPDLEKEGGGFLNEMEEVAGACFLIAGYDASIVKWSFKYFGFKHRAYSSMTLSWTLAFDGLCTKPTSLATKQAANK
jgi:hypothetical protein